MRMNMRKGKQSKRYSKKRVGRARVAGKTRRKKNRSIKNNIRKRRYKLKGGLPVSSVISPDGNTVHFRLKFDYEGPMDDDTKYHIRNVMIADYLGNQNTSDSFVGYHVTEANLEPQYQELADIIHVRVVFEPDNVILVEGSIETFNEQLTTVFANSTRENLPSQLKVMRDGEGDDSITLTLQSMDIHIS
jgi:hypothetical protein